MGELERLNRYFINRHEPVKDSEIRDRLDEIKSQMARDWQDYKRSRLILHGEEVKDNGLDMLIVYLIKRGFFDG